MKSKSFELAKNLLNKNVKVIIDRPLGSKHPEYDYIYEVNYGYIDGLLSADGENLDAYILSIDVPLKEFDGKVVAIIHRLEDDDDKLIVTHEGKILSDNEIEALVSFQEKWFKHTIYR